MNDALFYGLALAFANEIARAARPILTDFAKFRHHFLKNIVIGLPAFLVFGFFAATIVDWVASSTNVAQSLLVVICCWVFTLFFDWVLDGNQFLLQETRVAGRKRYALLCAFFYLVSLGIALIPYAKFPAIVGFDVMIWLWPASFAHGLLALVLMGILALLFIYFDHLDARYVAANVREILVSVCNRHSSELQHEDMDKILVYEVEDLEAQLRLVESYIHTASCCRFVHNRTPMPGLGDSRLSVGRVKEIAAGEQEKFLAELEECRYALKVLLAEEADKIQAEAVLRKSPRWVNQVDRLLRRRAQLPRNIKGRS